MERGGAQKAGGERRDSEGWWREKGLRRQVERGGAQKAGGERRAQNAGGERWGSEGRWREKGLRRQVERGGAQKAGGERRGSEGRWREEELRETWVDQLSFLNLATQLKFIYVCVNSVCGRPDLIISEMSQLDVFCQSVRGQLEADWLGVLQLPQGNGQTRGGRTGVLYRCVFYLSLCFNMNQLHNAPVCKIFT